MYELVLQDVSRLGPKCVLDVGCGTGKLLITLSKSLQLKLSIGLDISRAMIELARRNITRAGFQGLTDLVIGDAHSLPFRSECMGLVLSTGTLHHLRDLASFFHECKRVLSRSGYALLYELSHDVEDVYIPSRELNGLLRQFLKFIAAMHGIPRREFTKGYVKSALKSSACRFNVEFLGLVTKLIIHGGE